jgi:hypothetical protein
VFRGGGWREVLEEFPRRGARQGGARATHLTSNARYAQDVTATKGCSFEDYFLKRE